MRCNIFNKLRDEKNVQTITLEALYYQKHERTDLDRQRDR